MVKIILTNQLEDAKEKKVVLDLDTGTCLVDETESISLSQLKQSSFSHSLLTHPSLELKEGVYTYIHDDFAELVEAPRWVYATLLNANEPSTCQFVIKPSKKNVRLRAKYKFYLSLDDHKPAKEQIDVNQLNQIVTELCDGTFHYMDSIIMDQQFSYADLPGEINGDSLFESRSEVWQILTNPEDLHKLELRFINTVIGFGVFAREKIYKDELLAYYCGEKRSKETGNLNYYFRANVDILKMGTDAKYYGNITRFVNHAPNTDEDPNLLVANLEARGYLVNGLVFYGYQAKRDIKKNEQLLIDYGLQAFGSRDILRFNKKSESLDANLKKIREGFGLKSIVFRAMLHAGVRSAIFRFYKRAIIAVLLFGLLCIFLRYHPINLAVP